MAWTKSQRDWCLRPWRQNQTQKGSAFKVLFAINIFGLFVPHACVLFWVGFIANLSTRNFYEVVMIINKNIITKKVIFHPLEDINIKKTLHSEETETFEYFI